MKPITRKDNQSVWISEPGDTYLVTGITTSGKRFSRSLQSYAWAKSINLYRGSRWLVRNSKRYLIQRVWN